MELTPPQFFQMLADTTRLRCLVLVAQYGECCVCELTYALGMVQPKISRHLALLREAGIVTDHRQGQWVYYKMHEQLPGWARVIIDAAVTGSADQQPFSNDIAALQDMPNRPGSSCCA